MRFVRLRQVQHERVRVAHERLQARALQQPVHVAEQVDLRGLDLLLDVFVERVGDERQVLLDVLDRVVDPD